MFSNLLCVNGSLLFLFQGGRPSGPLYQSTSFALLSSEVVEENRLIPPQAPGELSHSVTDIRK